MKKKLLTILCLHIFCFASAQNPKLWGVASNGGATFNGTLITINGDGTGFDTACSMNLSTGAFPGGHLVLNGDGLFYGTTFEGGAFSAGTLFSLNPFTHVYTDLYNLDSLGSAWTNSDLIRENDSTFYGVIYQANPSPYSGRLFRYNPANNSYATIYNFNDSTVGIWPRNIMQYGNHKIYGTTDGGGLFHKGVLFSFDPLTSVYSNLHDFDNTAFQATGSLTEASNGLLYGIANSGGTNSLGAIFSFDPVTGNFTIVHHFDGTNGQPFWNNGVTQASDGKLYGMTHYGGSHSVGTIFCFDPVGNVFGKLYDLSNAGGKWPVSTMMQASDHKLYGMTTYGGATDNGVIFRFNPADSSYTKLKDLAVATGTSPFGGLTELPLITGIAATSNETEYKIYPNPACTHFTIRSSHSLGNKTTTISVMNLTGSVLQSEKVLPGKEFSLDISDLPSGIYFIKIFDGEINFSKKLIIQHN